MGNAENIFWEMEETQVTRLSRDCAKKLGSRPRVGFSIVI